MSRLPLASVLSINGGYVDTMGFVALNGLFTAHVTGNFVTLGAALVNGTGGALAKFLALPVFCFSVLMARLTSGWLEQGGYPVISLLLAIKFMLFAGAAAIFFLIAPANAGSAVEVLVGMILVVAMAIQNALHRAYLSDFPPTTLMTGTTTQIMLDLSDLVFGSEPARKTALLRLKRTLPAFVLFAAGCGAAALIYLVSPRLCFLVPPLFIAASILICRGFGDAVRLSPETEAR
ncbi:YoaK family protein [Martelella soudanensis]|uniref:YoaK family protein n=1 Tax=unclassified Martelella TaxID=2629616 RepID=UPI0015DEEC65|nr:MULTISPECIES: YoaK family protein [unclassified Martelella]